MRRSTWPRRRSRSILIRAATPVGVTAALLRSARTATHSSSAEDMLANPLPAPPPMRLGERSPRMVAIAGSPVKAPQLAILRRRFAIDTHDRGLRAPRCFLETRGPSLWGQLSNRGQGPERQGDRLTPHKETEHRRRTEP